MGITLKPILDSTYNFLKKEDIYATVQPLMFAAINVCVFYEEDYFAIFYEEYVFGRVGWNISLLLMFANC